MPSNQLFAQGLTVSGKIFDKSTSQILISVSVYDKKSLTGTLSDNSGNYTLTLPKGEHSIQFSYLGYIPFDTTIYLTENKELNIFLSQFTIAVGEITISAERTKDLVTSTTMGSFTLSNKEMMKMPSLLGETDPLKLLQLTPGIQTGTEGNMGIYVRGGGTDQNLILYDNNLLYNPGHLLGFFSIFNPELIKDITIIKSGIPALYGGKLSSVIKINSYKGSKDSLEVMGSVGLISSRIAIGGPLFKNKGSFILGVRQTYLELLVEPLIRHTFTNPTLFGENTSYNFYDVNAGAILKVNSRDNISFSGYFGRDNFNLGQSNLKQNNSLYWGNGMASLLWNHKFINTGEWNTNISFTNYEFDLAGSQADYFFGLFSSVKDYNFKSFVLFEKGNHHITTGLELIEHSFVPNKINAHAGNFVLNFGQFTTMNALEGGVFIDDEIPITSRFTIGGGIRFSFFNHHGPYKKLEKDSFEQITDTLFYPRGKSLAFFSNPEPRLILKYQINNNTSLKASYMRIAQYIHLATSATTSLPTDIWIPSTNGIKPLIGDQVSIGYFRNLKNNRYEFSTEIYYKKMHNQIEFLRGVVYNSIYGTMEDNIATGDGQSYGIEFYLHKKTGKYTGWISYTLSRTEFINSGLIYPAKYDRRHDLSVILIIKFNEKWNGSAVFVYTSGNAYTIPVGRYIIQGNIVNQYGDVNSFRMPAYNRLDVAVTRKLVSRRHWSSELTFSIYNVYNRANPYFIYFEPVGNLEEFTLEVRPVQVSLFPVIPSVSWSFKF